LLEAVAASASGRLPAFNMLRPSPPNTARVPSDAGLEEEPTLEVALPLAASPALRDVKEGAEMMTSLSLGALSLASLSGDLSRSRVELPSFCMSESGFSGAQGDLPDFSPESLGLPNCFRCPISQQVMADPVIAHDGRTYERSNLIAQGYARELQENAALSEAMEAYLALEAQAKQRNDDWHDYLIKQEKRASRKLQQHKQQVLVLRIALEKSHRRGDALLERRKMTSSSTGSTTASSESTPLESGTSAAPTLWAGGRAPRLQAPAASPVQGQPRRSTWSKLCLGSRVEQD